MAKSTLALLLVLTAISSLLVGVNLGKKNSTPPQVLSLQDTRPSPTATASPVPTSIPTIRPVMYPTEKQSSPSAGNTSVTTVNGISTFADKFCNISFRFPSTMVKQTSTQAQSYIFADPADAQAMIAVVCQPAIPKPPLASENIEGTMLGGIAATLYHDKNPDNSPRDEIIVHHPNLNTDVILAGWGKGYDQAVSSFKFIK